MTSIISSDFHFLVPDSFRKILVQIGTVVSEKIQFKILYVHDLGPRSRNDLDIQYSHTFIYSIRCLLLQTFRSLAAIVSVKSTVSLFPIEKPKLPKFICTNYDGQESLILHIKFRGNQPAGSREKEFCRFLPYMGMVAIMVM